MHLTNYAINKHNENFVQDDAVGSKRYPLLCSLPLPRSCSLCGPGPKLRLAPGRPTDPCPVPLHQLGPPPTWVTTWLPAGSSP